MSAKKRDEAVKDYNSGKVRVLLITSAGGVGLDLKNTKYVVILDPTWNDGNEKQITGRGARYQSHTGPDKNVYIIKLYMKKPSIGLFTGRKWNDKIPSADMLLKDYVKSKTKQLESFLSDIKKYAIS